MHTVWSRINNISALFSSCLMALLAAIALSSLAQQYFAPPLEPGSVAVTGLKVMHGKGKNYQHDHALVNFELDADLSSLFNWNTKQLFLYLDVEYTNSKGVKNAVVIWDRIVRSKSSAKFHVEGRQKYPFRDVTGFRDSAATYTLRYNLMPHVGALVYGVAAAANNSIPFPPLANHV